MCKGGYQVNLENKIGTGAQADVYLHENKAIKVFKQGYSKANIFYEAMVNSIIEETGLPIAKVYEVLNIEDKVAIRMEYIEGITLQECILADIDNIYKYIDTMVDLQMKIHSKNTYLPLGLKDKLRERISGNMSMDESKRSRLLKILDKLPEGNSLCHGDFHGYNIIKHGDEYYFIDWIDAAVGCADGDACRTYMLYLFHSPEMAEIYLKAYCAKAGKSREDILGWLPVVAAARLRENNEEEKEKILSIIENI